MIFSYRATQSAPLVSAEVLQHSPIKTGKRGEGKPKKDSLHYMMWLFLLLACLGASWFAYQYFLVPQTKSFSPDWHGAQWVKAADGNASTAYFRYVTAMKAVPDNAFVTVAANQVFRLYINGVLIGSNDTDFGNFPRAYMYDVTSSLSSGTNVIALRVANLDEQVPMLQVSFGVVTGGFVSYYGTGNGWQATTQPTLVYPLYTNNSNSSTIWANKTFDANAWLPVQEVAHPPISPLLTVNPLLYEQPISTHWISSGVSHDAYFVRQISFPAGITSTWIRLAATGTTDIFINGYLFITWNYQTSRLRQIIITAGKTTTKYQTALVLGIYDVSPYLHTGVNTIAVHISSPGVSGIKNGLANMNSEMSLDMLMNDVQGHATWLTSTAGWHVSHLDTTDWAQGSTNTLAWVSPVEVGRPDGLSVVYASKSKMLSSTQQGIQTIPLSLIAEVILFTTGAVLALWLLFSLILIPSYYPSRPHALEVMSLAYLPALACEGLLMTLAKEPQIPQPFPYTLFWGIVLIILVALGYLLLWLHAWKNRNVGDAVRGTVWEFIAPATKSGATPLRSIRNSLPKAFSRFLVWLRLHWAIILLVLLTVPLVFYDLGYEPYWQDELISYFVAKSILLHGLPLLPSGFVYPKGELYSYILALSMKVFGESAGTPRIISAIEYLITLALLYRVGCYFFDRRIALLATAMLAFSPHALIWARQVRMYQQAQLLTLLVVFLFYKAIQECHRVYLIYLAVGVLLVTYLSHEETFIILPALVICVMVASMVLRDDKQRLPSVLYQKHWWFAAAIGAAVIGIQLMIVKVTHPPVLGTDATMRPPIQLTTDNIPYYYNLLFLPTANDPSSSGTLASGVATSIMMNSFLAIIGCILARRSGNLRILYCALFLVISFLTLAFLFTMQADRYFYPLVPFYYLMGAYALMKMIGAIWTFVHGHRVSQQSEGITQQSGRDHSSLPLRGLVAFTASLVCLSVLILPMLPISSYNLFISRVTGLSYYHHFGDYEDVGQYMQQHLQKGDIVISVLPDSVVLYYVGRSDYFFSINHALFLFEQNSHIVDTYTGKIALLHETDFQSVLATYARIWIISGDNNYQKNVLRKFIFPPDFHIVYEGINSIIYLRGG